MMRGVYLASVWLHVLAAMTWLGGMVVFVAAVIPYFRRQPAAIKTEFLDWFGRRFRLVSWTCFAVLAVTGTFNLWARGVRLADFARPEWHATAFGQIVLLKLTLVAAAVLLTIVHERTAAAASARWVGRGLLLVGLAVVAAAVLLVRTL
jgi:putative copper resistance protein D